MSRSASFHAAERIGVDQLLGFRRQRAGEGNEIGLRQQCDDQQRVTAEFVLSLREVADHTAPDPFCLVVARLGKSARERQH